MMSKNVFLQALETFEDEFYNLCGGEAFLHPDIFWQIKMLLWKGTLRIHTNGSWILTKSGKFTNRFREFIRIGETECDLSKLTIQISNDWYHDEFLSHSVDTLERVLSDYTSVQIEHDNRKQTLFFLNMGRAKKNEIGSSRTTIADCADRFDPTILPNGDVSICPQGRQVIGNIMESNDYNYWYDRYKALKIPSQRLTSSCGTCSYNANKKLMERNLYEDIKKNIVNDSTDSSVCIESKEC
jgi:MoaA/NifB/PqqE/SkfB family radical SAM enzyme